MLFPTLPFALFFLLVFPLRWLLVKKPATWKVFMLASSYFFYGYWDWRFLGLIAACTVVNHGAAVGMCRTEKGWLRRLLIILVIIFDLGMLGFFKYYGFFTLSMYQLCAKLHISCSLPLLDIVLPVGISFFTFQAMSYVIDVYRKQMAPARHTIDFAVYLAFFPQLVAGPIVRARDLLPQVEHYSHKDTIDTGRATFLILGGLFKKIVVANYLAGDIVDPVFANPAAYGGLDILFAVYGYAVQIYCDFSAYSDIAIGLCLLLGFKIPINFNAPYLSTTIQAFWRRWHISLSSFLRDYLYIPLGGSRGSEAKTYRNLYITFLLGGLWHGAGWNFIIWGGLHGTYLSIERAFRHLRPGKPSSGSWAGNFLKGLVVFHLVCISWFFFRSPSFNEAMYMLSRLWSWNDAVGMLTSRVIILIIVGFLTQLMDGRRMEGAWNRFEKFSPAMQGAIAAVILMIILGLGPAGVAPFIYFQF